MTKPQNSRAIGKDAFEDQAMMLGKHSAPVIIDGGAYVGSTAVRYREVFDSPRVIAFEPCEETFKALQANLRSASNVDLVQAALAREDGYREFYLNKYSPTHSLYPRPADGKRYFPERASHESITNVRTVNLDNYLSSVGILHVDILKLDVQGGELDVLKGASAALEAGAFSLLFLETCFVKLYESPALFQDISCYLDRYGYSLFRMYDFEWARDGQVKFCNSLYMSPEFRMQYSDQSVQEP